MQSLVLALGLASSVQCRHQQQPAGRVAGRQAAARRQSRQRHRHRRRYGDAQSPARNRGRREARRRHLDRRRARAPSSRCTRTTPWSSSTPSRARSPRSCRWAPSPTASSPTRRAAPAWVTHEYPGTVSEIDLQKETVVARDQGRLAFCAASPSVPTANALYVTEFYTGVLHAFDLASGQGRRFLEGALHRQSVPARPPASDPAQGVPGAHSLDGRGQRRLRLDLSAAVDLRSRSPATASAASRSAWTPTTASTSSPIPGKRPCRPTASASTSSTPAPTT